MLMMFVGAIIVMLRFPEVPLARLLHRWLVEAPAARLARVHPAQIFFLLIVGGVLLAGGEVILLLGGAEAAMALSWQLSLYFDAGIAVAAAGALARLKPLVAVALQRYRKPLTTTRRPRRRERLAVAAAPPANDDDRTALAA